MSLATRSTSTPASWCWCPPSGCRRSIHTRSGNAKYLNELSNSHPLWLNSRDAQAHGVTSGDLVRLNTSIGYLVARVWVTEGIRPGVCALSHHMGRWRLHGNEGSRWVQGLADISHPDGPDSWLLRYRGGIEPFASDDPDSSRIWWDRPWRAPEPRVRCAA